VAFTTEMPFENLNGKEFYTYHSITEDPNERKKKKENLSIWWFDLHDIKHICILANLKFNISQDLFSHLIHF
jgi:hypothetical protein